ncbi:MAG TPA: hypothetical protein VGI74_08890 [Streptosporangiaceae bacterium]|jgi:hypothetical protein
MARLLIIRHIAGEPTRSSLASCWELAATLAAELAEPTSDAG